MKKSYQSPMLAVAETSSRTFLEISGEALGVDIFNDGFGQKFENA